MNTQSFLTDRQLIEVLTSTKVATAIHVGETAVIQTANQAMLAVWGKNESVIGKSLEDALPELKGQPFIEMFARVWREGITISGTDTPAELEVNGRLQTYYFDFEYRAVQDLSGKTICILHTATDISERHFSRQREQALSEELAGINEELAATNEELLATNDKLIQSQYTLQSLNLGLSENKNQLQFAIEAAELATWDYNPKTGRFSGNERLKDWFGLHPDGEIALTEATANIADEDRERVTAAIQQAMDAASGGTYDTQYRIVNPLTKVSRVVRAKGKTQFDASGQPVRLSGTLQDITEQVRREQYKDDFISIASHELKTPITSLKASLQLLGRLKEKIQPATVPRLIEQANKSMEKTSLLVEDLLNASKIGAGQLHLNKSTFNVARLLQNCCEHVRSGGRYELVVQGDEALQVFADEHRVDQVVVNLVNNAVKYASGSKQIDLIAEKIKTYVKISIRDSGPGIAPDKIPHLFERYYRSDYLGVQFSGIGLGLYISAEIIRKHGGQIGVESEVGKGSTFWFTLPAA